MAFFTSKKWFQIFFPMTHWHLWNVLFGKKWFCFSNHLTINPYSAGIDFSRQNSDLSVDDKVYPRTVRVKNISYYIPIIFLVFAVDMIIFLGFLLDMIIFLVFVVDMIILSVCCRYDYILSVCCRYDYILIVCCRYHYSFCVCCRYDYILTSETVYTSTYYESLHGILEYALAPAGIMYP